MGRKMGPPSPPPQQMGHYGMPPSHRAPPPNIGPPGGFPPSRELPALNSIPRTGSTGGGAMSIAGMLGGPPAHRELTPGGHPAGHAPFPPPSTTPGVSGPGPAYASSIHVSPSMQNAAAEYGPYSRRPQTPPDHARPYDARDQRGNAAASPPQNIYGTPELSRYGTPQAHPARGPPMAPGDDRRDQSGRMSAGSMPPRPSSQPRAYPGSGRPMEMGRGPPPGEPYYGPRREEARPGKPEYNPEGPARSLSYEEQLRLRDREYNQQMEAELRERERAERARFEEPSRIHQQQQRPPPFMTERERIERERSERDRDYEMRERERRERTASDSSRHGQRPSEYGPQGPQGPPGPHPQHSYGRDPRENGAWQLRPGYEQPPPRPPYEPYGPRPGPNDHPPSSGPPYGAYPAHAMPAGERYPVSGPPPGHAVPASQPGPGPGPVQPYESPDRNHRFAPLPHHQQAQHPPHHRRPGEEGAPAPSVAYNGGPGAHAPENGRRPMDDGHQAPPLARQQSSGGFLAIGEINRKGRISPLPQAVQGAQPQAVGPAGEPGIKSEFGRMFAGIGSGASAFGVSSPGPSHAPFTNAGLGRRDDGEPHPVEAAAEPPAKPPRKRNRKAKEDESKVDEDGSGRLTPGGRTKRVRTNHAHHHHHQYVSMDSPTKRSRYTDATMSSHHHHHHHHVPERTASPLLAGATPLKNAKSGTPGHSPPGLPLTHNHQIPRTASQTGGPPPARQTVQSPTIMPKPKKNITSQAVLNSVSHKPRKHLGDILYKPEIKPAKFGTHAKDGFRTIPRPLPADMIKDNENSTLTVKVSRAHLVPHAREEITATRALWGADVYTDDSDVIAACIHGGWFRGEWPEDVDTTMLDLEIPPPKPSKGRGGAATAVNGKGPQDTLTCPPSTGPMQVPPNRDLHVTLVVLPNLVKYHSVTRFGITSREWGCSHNGRKSIHDGLSFKVLEVRWVDGAAPQSRLRGKGRRERIRKELEEIAKSQVVDMAGHKKLENKGGKTTPTNGEGDKENRPVAARRTAGARNSRDTRTNGASAHEVREFSGEEDARPMEIDDSAHAEAKPTKVAA
jgi:hypothetical protein